MFDLAKPPEGARARRAWFQAYLALQPAMEMACAVAEAQDETYGVSQLRKMAGRYALAREAAHG